MERAPSPVEHMDGSGPIVLTCEHASVAMPSPWTWPTADRWLVGSHWSYDLGAADLTRALAEHTGWAAVLSTVSRLLVDPNRDLADPTLFRTEADGHVVHLNAGLSAEERQRRIDAWYTPYHQAVDAEVARQPGAVVFSVHTFTPVYEGRRREMELGVLFNDDEGPARDLASLLLDAGYHTRLNEPWSGRDGLIFGPETHARAHGRVALELEVRQDLATDPEWLSRFVPRLAKALRRTFSDLF